MFGELARRHSRDLTRYLVRYLGDATLADDVLQDTWLQVHLKCGLYDGAGSVRAWLYVIATRRAIDALRRAHRRAMVSLNQPVEADEEIEGGELIDRFPGEEPGPLEELERQEWQRWVQESVDRLPEKLRQTLILADYRGLKYHEVAAVLHVPLGTVKSRRNAALMRIRDMARQGHLMGVG